MSTQTREQFLESLGLPADGDSLAPAKSAPVTASKKAAEPPVEVTDERLIPVSSIVFTEDMIEGLDLETQFQVAYRVLFERFKSPKNSDRNKLLHQAIDKFLYGLRAERRSGGTVKEKIKATAEERDMAKILHANGVTKEQLLSLLQELGS